MIGEVRFADDVQPRDRGHEIVVHPQPAHRVVRGREDAHGRAIGVLVRDALVHLEEVAVAFADRALAEALDRRAEVQVDAEPGLADAAPGVARFLRGTRSDVARREVAEARVLALEVVIALFLGDVSRCPRVTRLLRDPDAPVVAQRLAHQRQLRLVLAAHGDARRMDLRVARVRERRALLVRAPIRGRVAALRVRREVENVAVAARREHDGVRDVRAHFTGDEIARDDAARDTRDDDELEHLVARVHAHATLADHAFQRRIRAEQELLTRLTARVEGARHLGSAEAPVREEAAVLARERHALRDALVDDLHRRLCESVHVGFARTEVAALHGVVEKAIDAVAVVLIVLRGVDAALRGDRVRAPRAVLEAERVDLVAELGHRRGR